MLKRIRGRKLQAINRRLADKEPLCRACLAKGVYRAGTQTDHIEPLHKGGAEHDTNRQRLCDECHEEKTRRDMGHKDKSRIGVDGWPIA